MNRPILFLAIAQTLVWAGFYYLFPALLLRWEQSLGWSKIDLTAAITLAIFLSAMSAPLAGRLIDAGKGALMMTASSLCGGLCLVWLSLVSSLVEFYFIWALLGVIMAGCLYEPCFALITRAKGENAKKSIITVTLVAGFASTLCYPSIYALAEAYGWRSAVRVFAAVLILIATPLMWLGAQSVEQAGKLTKKLQTESATEHYSFLKRPVFWLLALGFTLLAIVQGVTVHHMFPILADRGINSDAAVMAASFIGPMQVAGRLAMMVAERHISFNRITASCFVVFSLAILLLINTAKTPMLLVGFVILFGSAHGVVSIVRPVIAREILGGNNFGAKFGAMALFYLVGSASAPYLGSLIWGIGGYDLVLFLLIALALIGMCLYIAAHRMVTGNSSKLIT